jgi:NADPH-dependent glutamate synthase beta subunit-like oxidoreductase
LAKKKEIDQLVERFKDKVERARQSENYPLEVQKAVQELVLAIGAAVPKPVQTPKDPEKGVQMAVDYMRNYTGSNKKLPKEISTILENFTGKKK